MKTICKICPHHCSLDEGQTGLCHARINIEGKICCKNYGKVTSISLDPIEKKPLKRFYPGSEILSVGSFGCNLCCPFCQNSEISMSNGSNIDTENITPEYLVDQAFKLVPYGNIGIAYTYNEPLIGYEFVFDCSKLSKAKGLMNIAITNGFICEEPLLKLLPYIDAMNIDLKGFTEHFYKMAGGELETVKRTIQLSAERCHVEVTTLIIPGENDSESEIDSLSAWLASVDNEIPLHISRFFPKWHMMDRDATPVDTVYRLADIARNNLKYVYEGNC